VAPPALPDPGQLRLDHGVQVGRKPVARPIRTPNALPSRSCWRPPTATTRRCSTRSSMRSRRSLVRAGDRADPTSARPDCTPTRATTSPDVARRCGAGHQPADRPPRCGVQPAAGPPPLEGRADSVWLLGCRRLSVRYERRADLLRGCCTWPAPCCACGRSGEARLNSWSDSGDQGCERWRTQPLLGSAHGPPSSLGSAYHGGNQMG
jgi:hypothetical protein